MLYGRLDDLREQASARLAEAVRQSGSTPGARTERDATTAWYTDTIARLNAGENRLCFGRLDFHDAERRYIGRLGLLDESVDYEPLLIDWRAPAARPYYLATAASPEGVRRRRHIRTSGRTVTGIEDEVLDLATAAVDGGTELTAEAALLAALDASRTGRMADIVETIQAEQDRIIRSDHSGVLVVQGGPGTGKTAVALHRAAYLLYTYREQLAQRGVLIVGPNSTFLRYIGQVLPALGETGVLLGTIGELYPGIRARRTESPEAAAVKGRLAMAGVVAAAVRDRQRFPDDVLRIESEHGTLLLDRQACEAARDTATEGQRPHNEAQPAFARAIIDALARQVADRIGADLLGGDNLLDQSDVDDIRVELRDDPAVQAALGELWPTLTPQRLLADLLADAARLGRAAPGLSAHERELLVHVPEGGWTVADVPLLDEAAELLGDDERAAAALAERQRRVRIAAAQGVLDILAGSAAHELDDLDDWGDHESLMVGDLLDAARLAERQEDHLMLSAAERAAADRRWTFGHVIVDEAQELSEMAWRMLMRRCPSRSMTIVGDLAQTGSLAGTSSWQRVLEPYVADRWRLAPLTINYRTPAEIMAIASDVLAGVEPPRSVRHCGLAPWRSSVPEADLAEQAAGAAGHELTAIGDGKLAVLVPRSRLAEVGRAVAARIRDTAIGEQPDLESPVAVLTIDQAKGLEFDSVLVVDPGRILDESHRGANDLYVALTRTTRRLGVLHTGQPPAVLARIAPAVLAG